MRVFNWFAFLLLFVSFSGFAQLSGTYTVNPSGTGDYTTIQQAADDLTQQGIAGSVTINIAAGTYDEQVIIDTIPGTSANRKVIFQSQAQDTSVVLLTNTSTTTPAEYTLLLRNVQHVTVRHLTIRNAADNKYNTVVVMGNCVDIALRHNRIQGNTPFLVGGGAAVETTFFLDTVNFRIDHVKGPLFLEGNTIEYAATGLQLTGNVIDTFNFARVKNNVFRTKTGMISIYVDSIAVVGNTFDGRQYDGTGVSIGFSPKALVQNNRIYRYAEGVSASSGFDVKPVRIYNNVIAVQGERALFLANKAEVYHNSILNRNDNDNGFIYTSGFAAYDTVVSMQNNIFCNYAEGGIVLGASNIVKYSDYNAYYTLQDTFHLDFFTVKAKDLAEWRDSTGQDANSIVANPFFDTDTTLSPAASALKGAGQYMPSLPTDINGYPRDPNEVTVGAIEITATPNLEPTVVTRNPDTVITGNGLQVNYTGTNSGTADLTGSWTDGIFLCSSPSLADSVLRLTSVAVNRFLPAGSSYNKQLTVGIPDTLSGGTYYVVVWLNENQTVFDDGSDNVKASAGVTIIPSDRPNLVVTSISTPPAIQSGQVVNITWTVQNTGQKATSSTWYDYVYWEADSNYFVNPNRFNPDSLRLFAVEAPTGLLPGETYTQTKSYRLPLQMSGVYHPAVFTDGGRQLLEEIEGTPDNMGVGSVNVSQVPLADLEVMEVNVPATVFSGEMLKFSYKIRNSGSAAMAVDKRWDWIALSRDTMPEENTFRFAELEYEPSYWKLLQPLEEHIVQDSFRMPYCEAGEFYLYVFTNKYKNVPEISPDNNTGYQGPIEVVVRPNPDLIISKVEVSSAPAPSTEEPVIIEYTLRNDGLDTVIVPKFYADVLYMHDGATWDSLTAERTGFNNFTEPFQLLIGEDTTLRTSFTIPADRYGQQYISVYTDISNKVCELPFENNNVGTSAAVNVTLAPQKDLEVTQVNLPTNVVAGDQVALSYVWSNNGPGSFSRTIIDSIYLVPTGGAPNKRNRLTYIEHENGLSGNGSRNILRNITIPIMTEPGTYDLVIRTDAGDRLYEHQAENNNTTVVSNIPITRDPNRLPDLIATALSTSGQAFSGQSLSFSYTVENRTTKTTFTSAWEDRIELLYPDSTVAAYTTRYRNTPLSGQDQYTVSSSFTIPNGLEGTFLLRIHSDYGKDVLEYNNSNNKTVITVPVTLSPWPDLTVSPLPTVDTLVYGQPNVVPFDITNDGQGTADTPWTNRLYLSTDRFLDKFDIRIYNEQPATGPLNSGGTYTETRSFRFSNAPAGFYYLLAETDALDNVYEHTDEDNNLTSSLGQVYVHKPLPSDLLPVADSIVLQKAGYITYTLENKGPNPAKGSWTDVLYLSDDKVWDPTDPYLGDVEHPDTTLLLPGDAFSAYWSGAMPFVKPGWYYVLVRSDAFNLMPETDITNNLVASVDSFYLDPVTPLTPNVAYDTSYPKFGWRSHYYSVPVNANEGIVMTMDAHTPSTAVELFYRKDELPGRGGPFDARGSNAFESSQKLLVASDTAAYTGYSLAQLDFSIRDSVPYTILAETRTFSLESVTPDHGGNEGIVVLDIRGFDLSDSMRVSLVNAQDTAEAHHVFPINTLEVRAHINTNGVAAGVYDLVLDRLDKGGQAVLPQAYTLEDSSYNEYYLQVMAPDAALINTPTPVTVSFGNLGNINDYDVMLAIPIYREGFFNDGFSVKYMGDGVSNTMPDEARALHPFDSTALIEYEDGYLFLAWYPILPNEGRTNFTFEVTGLLADTVHITPHIFRNPISPIHFSGDTADLKYTYFMQQLDSILSPPDPAGAGFRNANCNTDPEQLEAIIYAGVRQQAEYTLGGLPTSRSAAAGTAMTNALKNTFNPESSPEVQEVAKDLMDGWKGNESYKESFVPGSNSYYEYLIRNLGKCLDLEKIEDEIQYKCLRRLTQDDAKGRAVYTYKCPPDDPPGGGGGGWVDDIVDFITSWDPNEIIGPAGEGAPRYVDVEDPMMYTVNFENKAEAGAPARFVSIENPLPEGFDIKQFRLGEVGWGDTIISLPNTAYYTGSVQLGPEYFNHRVDIVAGIDAVNRKAFWRFTTIDPATGAQPTNPKSGFLPPNDTTGIGEGFVRYTIAPEDTLSAGYRLSNQADIQFDQEKVIATNVWTNTISGEGLQSSMLPRPNTTDSTTFRVAWDVFYADSFAVTAERVEVYVKESDTGTYQLWTSSATNRSDYFTGERGKTYYFYSLAYGENGQPETKIKQEEISVTVDTATGIARQSKSAVAWQLHPNPYQDHLQMQLTLPASSEVAVWAYDLYGRRLGILYQGSLAAGAQQLTLPRAAALPAGMLLIELRLDGQQHTKRLIHLR